MGNSELRHADRRRHRLIQRLNQRRVGHAIGSELAFDAQPSTLAKFTAFSFPQTAKGCDPGITKA